ncbi:unnamed protein product [Arabidopsis arenosa]|uniref:Uncharacterized protein n=1 Tax=Arabidopsis arenosa TaxID=38785 RepID=A0A8S2A549_ARAAE|nr:unnamed protein product [Arabidopsis arenosa]
MGKSSKAKKKPPGGISLLRSTSPASSPSISDGGVSQSPSGSTVAPGSPVNASALSAEKGSAIIQTQIVVSSDLGNKQQKQQTLGSSSGTSQGSQLPSKPSHNASATALATGSAISKTLASGELDLGQQIEEVISANPPDPLVSSIDISLPQSKSVAVVSNSVEPKEPQDPKSSPPKISKDPWVDLFKGPSKNLSKKGKAFILPSGEACVKIPNSVIERNLGLELDSFSVLC